jgi:hypothetical protein
MLYEPQRHEPLRARAWDESRARDAVTVIAADTETRFDADALWPIHPLEWGREFGLPSFKMLYIGAAGVIWALDYLARVGAIRRERDYQPFIAGLLADNRRDFQALIPDLPSYLVGDVGILLVGRRLTGDTGFDEQLASRIADNIGHPSNELMAGTPGTMLAALFLFELTNETVWRELFVRSADQVWDEWRYAAALDCHLWMQDWDNQRSQMIGAVHGFASSVQPLLRGARLLDRERQADLYRRCATTLERTAMTEDDLANWPQRVGEQGSEGGASLLQYCHGAPGVIVALSDFPVGHDANVERLLRAGAELTWRAGPLTKGPGLCHGTAGNGYAFLKLYERTREPMWLDRARLFAMHAIEQCDTARARHGQGRYSLWTGDMGLAVYLWQCIEGRADSPTIDAI